MLKHEPAETPTAAEARVTPEELNAALKTLEDQQSSTVAIGSVVDELRLNATSEQIWEQVQKQREEKQEAPKAAVFTSSNAPARRRLRSWREIKGWVWVLFWCSGGLGLITGGLHLVQIGRASTSQTITIDGDAITEPIQVQGKDVVISGDHDTLTLQGTARSVEIEGDFDTLNGDNPESYSISGERGIVHFKAAAKPVQAKPIKP